MHAMTRVREITVFDVWITVFNLAKKEDDNGGRGNDQKPLHEPVIVAPCTRKRDYVEGHCSWPFLRVQEQCAQRFEEQSAHLLHMRVP
jgi:hypothetical protein